MGEEASTEEVEAAARAIAQVEHEPEHPFDDLVVHDGHREKARAALAAARATGSARSGARLAACPGPHAPVQHRDGKPQWCRLCGTDANGCQQRDALSPHVRRLEAPRG